MSPAQTAITAASMLYPSGFYSGWAPRSPMLSATKLPHDKATKRRRARNKAARKSRQRNR